MDGGEAALSPVSVKKEKYDAQQVQADDSSTQVKHVGGQSSIPGIKTEASLSSVKAEELEPMRTADDDSWNFQLSVSLNNITSPRII
jgi:hypothetical protein